MNKSARIVGSHSKLWATGLQPGRAHRKCAKICGDTSGNYHPHFSLKPTARPLSSTVSTLLGGAIIGSQFMERFFVKRANLSQNICVG